MANLFSGPKISRPTQDKVTPDAAQKRAALLKKQRSGSRSTVLTGAGGAPGQPVVGAASLGGV